MRIPVKLDLPFKSYTGFKFLIAAFVFVVFLWPALRLYVRHGAGPVVRDYVYSYWVSGLEAAVIFAILLSGTAVVFWFNRLEHYYHRTFRRFRRDRHVNLECLTFLLSNGAVVIALYVVPFLHLYTPAWWRYALAAVPTTLGILGYFAWFSKDMVRETIPGLAAFDYPKQHFDTATLAPISEDLREEIAGCVDWLSEGANSQKTRSFITDGNVRTVWRGLNHFFLNLSRLFGVPPDRITLHDRTTAAIEFALSETLNHLRDNVAGRPIVVVTTDCEYPHVRRRLLAEFEESHGIEIREIPLAGMIWRGERQAQIAQHCLDFIREHSPDAVFLSHVIYWSGTVLDIEAIAGGLAKLERRPLFIVDGAQAAGNVEIDPDALDQVDYYAASCHKWLLVPHPMGILLRHERRLESLHGFGDFRPPGRPFSSFPVARNSLGVTVNMEPYFGLGAVLEEELFRVTMTRLREHNEALCAQFLEDLRFLGVRIVGSAPHASMAVVSLEERTEALYAGLERRGIACHLLCLRVANEARKVIRFCFHYFHSEYDVFELTRAVEEEIARLDTLSEGGHLEGERRSAARAAGA